MTNCELAIICWKIVGYVLIGHIVIKILRKFVSVIDNYLKLHKEFEKLKYKTIGRPNYHYQSAPYNVGEENHNSLSARILTLEDRLNADANEKAIAACEALRKKKGAKK